MKQFDDCRTLLFDLRLVNRTFSLFVTPKLFHTVTTWLIDYELERLANIANHPELSKHVKRIIFQPWEIPELDDTDTMTETKRSYLQKLWSSDYRVRGEIMDPRANFGDFADCFRKAAERVSHRMNRNDYPELRLYETQTWRRETYNRAFLQRGLRRHQQYYHEQVIRRSNGMESRYLAASFRKYVKLEHISFHWDQATDRTQFVCDTGILPDPSTEYSSEHFVPVVMKALNMAHPHIKKFDIDFGIHDNAIRVLIENAICNMAAHGPHMPAIVSFSELVSLTLKVGRWREEEVTLENTRIIARLIEASPQLKDLEIELHVEDYDLPSFSSLFGNQHIPLLRHLRLFGLVTEEQQLITFLDSHSQTLQSLELVHVDLVAGTWLSVIEQIRYGLSLSHASLSNMWERQNPILNQTAHSQEDWILYRGCFREHPDEDIRGHVNDYACHKMDFNPLARALATGYIPEDDNWPDESQYSKGWVPYGEDSDGPKTPPRG